MIQKRNNKHYLNTLIMYTLEFIKWYSGMSEEKILAAHKKWLRETGQDITDKEYKGLMKMLYPKNKNSK